MVVWLSPLVSACRGESWEFATRNLEINPQPSILRVSCESISSRHAVFQSLLMPACPSVLCCSTLLPVLGVSVLIGAAVHHDSLQSCTVQSQSGVHWVAGWLRPVEVAVWPDFSQRGGRLASRLPELLANSRYSEKQSVVLLPPVCLELCLNSDFFLHITPSSG